MSDVNLFAFGCVVSFIALAGFYVYAREHFTRSAGPERIPVEVGRSSETEKVRRVA